MTVISGICASKTCVDPLELSSALLVSPTEVICRDPAVLRSLHIVLEAAVYLFSFFWVVLLFPPLSSGGVHSLTGEDMMFSSHKVPFVLTKQWNRQLEPDPPEKECLHLLTLKPPNEMGSVWGRWVMKMSDEDKWWRLTVIKMFF